MFFGRIRKLFFFQIIQSLVDFSELLVMIIIVDIYIRAGAEQGTADCQQNTGSGGKVCQCTENVCKLIVARQIGVHKGNNTGATDNIEDTGKYTDASQFFNRSEEHTSELQSQ